jgi:RNA polymerase sigma factor (sigma-70 family)
VNGLAIPAEHDLLAIDEALDRLEQVDERAARVVELRFFAGLTEVEAAEALGISEATLKRDWAFGRAWLLRHLQ